MLLEFRIKGFRSILNEVTLSLMAGNGTDVLPLSLVYGANGSGKSSVLSAFADLNTERAVVAALLIEPTCISTVLTILGGISAEEAAGQKKKSRDVDSLKRSAFHGQAAMIFYDPKHAAVYEAILDLSEKGVGIDVLSVSDYLERNSKLEVIGGQEYLLEIQSSIVSTANVESWCHTLRDYAMLREMIRTCSAAVDMCRNTTEDVKSLLDTIESEIFKVRNRFVQPEVRDLRGLMQETFEYFMRVYNREIDPGIPTEYPDLDALIGGGLKPGLNKPPQEDEDSMLDQVPDLRALLEREV